MKTDTFKLNGLIIERRESREGPSPYFITYYKNTSRITTNVKSIKRFLKLGRGTETLQQLNDWLESFKTKVTAIPEAAGQVAEATGHVADAA
jgi:hypothetical protein